jgi:hypothetical protein
LLPVLVALFLASTIIFAVLFAIEKHKTEPQPTPASTIFHLFFLPYQFNLFSDDTDLCLTPYCIKAGM